MTTPSPQDRAAEVGHTPGPWRTHPRFPLEVVPAAHAGRPVGGDADKEADLRDYAQTVHSPSSKDQRHRGSAEIAANARLISAAPELADALSELYQKAIVGTDAERHAALENAARVLIKARGFI